MNSASPLFSVIIPTYNRAEKLKHCLDSLAKQTYKNFEILVCDDGSTDNSKDVVEQFKDVLDIKNFWNENWGGPARPRNVGIKNAKADWVCFLDSDDLWFPNKLEVCKGSLNNFDLIYHSLIINHKGEKLNKTRWVRNLNSNAFRDLMLNGNAIPTSSVCMRKQLLIALGGFSEDKRFRVGEDFDLWIRASLENCRFKYIPLVLGEYWVGEGNISSFGTSDLDYVKIVYDQYVHKLTRKDIQRQKAVLTYSYGLALQQNGNRQEAKKKYREVFLFRGCKIKIKALYRLLFK